LSPEAAAGTERVDIPFPVLDMNECMILAEVSGSESCGGKFSR
jgi:hypothetical protein